VEKKFLKLTKKGKPAETPARCRPSLAGGLELLREPARDALCRAQQPLLHTATAGL